MPLHSFGRYRSYKMLNSFVKDKTWKYSIHPHTFLKHFTMFYDAFMDVEAEEVHDQKRIDRLLHTTFSKLSFKTIEQVRKHPERGKTLFVIEPQMYDSLKPLSTLSEEELGWFYEFETHAVTGGGADLWFVVDDAMIRTFSHAFTLSSSHAMKEESVDVQIQHLEQYVKKNHTQRTRTQKPPRRRRTRKPHLVVNKK